MESSTRERLVAAARTLFAEKGYGSTSVQDILRAAEANSGSLYHAFPTKQHLLIAVLEDYLAGLGPRVLARAWAKVEDPIERVFALLKVYRDFLRESECVFGCPIGSLALEIHEPDPPVRELLAKNFENWVAQVEQCLRDAGNRLPRDLDRHALAVFVLTTMEGGVMQARTHRSLEAFDAGVKMLRDYFVRLEGKKN